MRLLPTLVFALALGAGPAFAVQPDEVLRDPNLEARARTISGHLRCLVCQNQSIDESDAPLAKDLRILVRERLAAGESDAKVQDFIVQRYGEFVLLRPPFSMRTALLWLTPAIIFGFGALGLAVTLRRRRGAAADSALTENEQEALSRLLKEDSAATAKR